MTESMRKKEESKLLNDIIRELYPLAVMERVNCGVARWPDGRPCRLAPTGHSDLRGVLRADKSRYGVAVPIYIEAKYGDGEATKEQIEFLQKVRGYGCIAGIAYSVAQAYAIIKPHLKG